MVDSVSLDDSDLTCRAVLGYATYMATNQCRRAGEVEQSFAIDVIEQHCKNATRGHAACIQCVDARWSVISAKRRRRHLTEA